MNKINPENVHKLLGKYILADGYDMVLDLKKSRGSYLYDSKKKAYILDFFTFFASSPIGYNHPKMTDPDFIYNLGEIAINKPVNSDLYTIEMARFIETFASIAKPDYMKYMFFISGGALAVENALKTAMDWKVRKNLRKGLIKETGRQVIHFKNAFHGRSGYTLSLTNTFDPRKTMYFEKFNWPRITNPKITFPLNDKNLSQVKKLEGQALKEIKKSIKNEGDDICAIIFEPVQGEGGDNHYRPEFFKALRTLCNENDIMLIADEVQSGLGLTGKMWAVEHYNIKPDIIVFGKKTQICGIMSSSRVDDIDNHVFRESSRINSTFGGNLVDMVRSGKYLEIIDEENLVDNAADIGAFFLLKLQEMSDFYPDLLSNTRGKGLMCAFDLPDTKSRDKFIKLVYDNQMMVLPTGEKSVRFRPPLNIDKNEINDGIKILESCISDL